MEKGADPNKEDKEGMTPLDVAVQRCAHQDVIKKLYDGGANPISGEEDRKTRKSPKKMSKSKEYDWIFMK